MDQPRTTIGHGRSESFAWRATVVILLVAVAYLLWVARHALLISFAAIVVATVFATLARPLQARLGLSHRAAVIIAIVGLIAVLAGVFLLAGNRVLDQVAELSRQLGSAIPLAQQRLGQVFGQSDATAGQNLLPAPGQLLQEISSWTFFIAQIATGFILVVITGGFLALDPGLYRNGLIKLFPQRQHDGLRHALDASGEHLRRWLLGESLSMLAVGALAGLGAWWLGLPAPMALGLFAGLAEFIPTVGPIIGAVPALLLAFSQGGWQILWTLLLFLAIQQLESNMITPLIQRRAVRIPPALFILSVFTLGAIFGVLGVLVAGPLTVVAYVLVKRLYVQDTLGNEGPPEAEDSA